MPPAASQLLDKYLQAVGGADALQKITTRVERGNLLFGQNQTAIEIYAKAPNKRISVSHSPNGESMTAFDGTAGWLGNTGRPARDMAPFEAQGAMVDAIFALALDAKKVYTQFRPAAPEKIGDKEVYVLFARGKGAPLTKFFFDEQSGLLIRLERYSDVGLGLMPVRVDYADYRDADGIKIPFRWTLSRPNGRFTIQIDSVQQNVTIDDSKFSKPAAPAAGGAPPGR
jgi:outer membrane lipoprotein-sorting protein